MQTAESHSGLTNGLVLLHDGMPMRRAQLAAFLHAWSTEERVDLVVADLPDAYGVLTLDPSCRMAIFSIGSAGLDRSATLHHLLDIADKHTHAAGVVLAELGSAHDAAAAFQAGAKGYIPAWIEPDLALRALSFILRGGHFFPPNALLMPAGFDGGNGGERGGVLGRVHRLRSGNPALRLIST